MENNKALYKFVLLSIGALPKKAIKKLVKSKISIPLL